MANSLNRTEKIIVGKMRDEAKGRQFQSTVDAKLAMLSATDTNKMRSMLHLIQRSVR